jgi:hypothetical protein
VPIIKTKPELDLLSGELGLELNLVLEPLFWGRKIREPGVNQQLITGLRPGYPKPEPGLSSGIEI